MTYAAVIWGDAAKRTALRGTLNNIQRRALFGVSCAYSSASTEAIQVITGCMPLDLEIGYRKRLAEVRSLDSDLRKIEERIAYNECMDSWQVRWNNSIKGRWTYSLIPDVRLRVSTPLWLNHGISHFLTGHGDLVESPTCRCGTEDETVEHVIFRCAIMAEERQRLELAVLRSGELWPCETKFLISNRKIYECLDKFAARFLERWA